MCREVVELGSAGKQRQGTEGRGQIGYWVWEGKGTGVGDGKTTRSVGMARVQRMREW